jgi:hypothetical protein
MLSRHRSYLEELLYRVRDAGPRRRRPATVNAGTEEARLPSELNS